MNLHETPVHIGVKAASVQPAHAPARAEHEPLSMCAASWGKRFELKHLTASISFQRDTIRSHKTHRFLINSVKHTFVSLGSHHVPHDPSCITKMIPCSSSASLQSPCKSKRKCFHLQDSIASIVFQSTVVRSHNASPSNQFSEPYRILT